MENMFPVEKLGLFTHYSNLDASSSKVKNYFNLEKKLPNFKIILVDSIYVVLYQSTRYIVEI